MPRFAPWHLALLVVLGACSTNTTQNSGVEADAGPSPNACSDVLEQLQAAIDDGYASPGSCTADTDCVLLTPRLACDGGGPYVEGCPLSLSAASAARATTAIAAATAAYCERSCGAGGVADCKPLAAVCDGGVCTVAVAP